MLIVDIVSWFVYISGLKSWSAFVWSIILVLLCQHDFSDAWTCFSICSLRLCMCFFSLHHHWAYPKMSCLVTFCALSWLLFYTGAQPHPQVHQMLCRLFSLLILFLDLCGSSHWGIPPSLGLSGLLCAFSLLDLFLDLCELPHWGIPPLVLFYWGIPPLFGFTVSRVDFMVVRPILSIFTSYHLGHSPYRQFV